MPIPRSYLMNNMMKAFILVLFPLVTTGQVTAQPDSLSIMRFPVRGLGLSAGIIHARLIDEGFTDSKLFFRGNGTKFRLDYSAEEEKYVFTTQGEGSAGTLRTRSGKLATEIYTLNVTVNYLRR